MKRSIPVVLAVMAMVFAPTLLLSPAAEGVEGTRQCGVMRGSDGWKGRISAIHLTCRKARRILRYWFDEGPGVHYHPQGSEWWSLDRYPGWRCGFGAGAGGCSKGRRIAAYSSHASRPLATSVVLGGVVYAGEYGEGWGVERPHTIYNGGVPSGLISKVHWSSWGGAVARGRGRHPIYKPRGGYYRHPVVAQLKATRIGSCEGRDAYLKLMIREPRRPGGPLGPWYSWSGPQTICEPYGSSLGRSG